MTFESIVHSLAQPTQEFTMPVITNSQYNTWRCGYIFEALKGQRYGQSFCNYFGITDNILFFESQAENCHRYIKNNYIQL